jgi:ATP-dependent Clp protease adaptor protein ClpS
LDFAEMMSMTIEEILRLDSAIKPRPGWRAKTTGGDEDDGGGTGGGTVTERKTRTQSKTKRPPMYKVILLNDDYTPMEFVVELLKSVFHKAHAEATRIMLWVHQNGMGIAGVYPFEVAETKVRTVEELAREAQYPLKCVMEKE